MKQPTSTATTNVTSDQQKNRIKIDMEEWSVCIVLLNFVAVVMVLKAGRVMTYLPTSLPPSKKQDEETT